MEKIYEDAYMRVENDVLTVGNSLIERRWRIRDGFLYNMSMTDRVSGSEWMDAESGTPSPCPERLPGTPLLGQEMTAEVTRDVCVEEEFLLIRVFNKYEKGGIAFNIKIYPGTAGISTFVSIDGLDSGQEQCDETGEKTVGIEGISGEKDSIVRDLQEYFHLPHVHHYLTQVSLYDMRVP